MAKRSDDQRKAMFANMANPNSKRKSKRLKKPKATKSIPKIKSKSTNDFWSKADRTIKSDVKLLSKKDLPQKWRKERGDFALYGYSYVKVMPKKYYKGDSNYRCLVEDWRGTKRKNMRVIAFRNIPAQYGSGGLKKLIDVNVTSPKKANRIAIQFMNDVNIGKYN